MRTLLACLFVGLLGGAAAGQEVTVTPEISQNVPASNLLTVDLDQMFSQSLFGQRIAREYSEAREELRTENQRIAAALRAEELDLAARRPDMDLDVFRAEAVAFDEKTQAIRRAQDAKERALETSLADGREAFLGAAEPILDELMADRGAAVLLDRRLVFLSRDSVDVTQDAITMIDARIGAGTP